MTSNGRAPSKPDLKRVRADIRRGDLGRARERLHGLLSSYPENLDLRKRLGEVYWSLQMPAMAGRYWYLVKDKDERMLKACQCFERECKNDPMKMLLAIKFRGDADRNNNKFARDTLRQLYNFAVEKNPRYAEYLDARAKREKVHKPKKTAKSSDTGCWVFMGALLLILILAIVGLIGVIGWVIGLF